jgi:hypothetical protein
VSIQMKPLAEITQKAIGILCKEIGVVNTVRFLNQFTTGYGNYTEERDQLFSEMTLADIVSDIEKLRNKKND